MADDRMYIRCRHCGGCLMLAKSFGWHWRVWGADNPPINPDADVPSMTMTLDKSGVRVVRRQFNAGKRLEDWLHEHTFGHEALKASATACSYQNFELTFEED